VDDIDQVTVEDMKAQGLQPAAVVETSHRNRGVDRSFPQPRGSNPGGEDWQVEGTGQCRLSALWAARGIHQPRTNTWTIVPVDPWVKVVEATGQAAGDAERVLALTRQGSGAHRP